MTGSHTRVKLGLDFLAVISARRLSFTIACLYYFQLISFEPGQVLALYDF